MTAGATGVRLVGCVMPKGVGLEIMNRLFHEKGLTRVELHSARGFMGSDPTGLFNRVEKDFLMAIVEEDRADDIFDWIYREARVSEVEGRFLYMTRLNRATAFEIPEDVPLES
jgi:hypothetical protein